jgi:uncharacterized protein YeaO (DUF488 family)
VRRRRRRRAVVVVLSVVEIVFGSGASPPKLGLVRRLESGKIRLARSADSSSRVPIRTKRWNDPGETGDGYRLLICRYRPRGVRKEDETWDAWCKALAPSVALHAAAYGKGGPAISWEEYRVRFFEEMKRARFWLDGFAAKLEGGQTMTLLCSSACVDAARCHRTLVKEMLEAWARGAQRKP